MLHKYHCYDSRGDQTRRSTGLNAKVFNDIFPHRPISSACFNGILSSVWRMRRGAPHFCFTDTCKSRLKKSTTYVISSWWKVKMAPQDILDVFFFKSCSTDSLSSQNLTYIEFSVIILINIEDFCYSSVFWHNCETVRLFSTMPYLRVPHREVLCKRICLLV